MSFFEDLFAAGVRGEKPPDEPKWNKWIHRNLSENHCPECLMLNECWFLKEKNCDGMISFITGWMVKPNGYIQLNTPYGGK